jgi:propanediol utilization protein
MPREQLERVVRQVVREQFAARPADGAGGQVAGGEQRLASAYTPNVVVNISARHVHITQGDLEKLFGAGTQLTVYRWLYQPGEFAAEQTVTVIGPRRRAIENVRILGPVRSATQVEVSSTDAVALGVDAPTRPSGKIEGSAGCILLGPKGIIELPKGVIRAERHVHMSPLDASVYGFADGQRVKLRVTSSSVTTFENLLCRVDPKFLLEVHLDTDEGNACDLVNATAVELLA